MRIKLYFLLLCFTSIHANDVTSHTFFSVRSPFMDASPEKVSLLYDRELARDCGWHGVIQLVPFGGKTRRDCGNKLARFFMPFGKTCLVTGEFGSEAVLANQADVVASYFGVRTNDPSSGVLPDEFNFFNQTFQSNISFNPAQSMAGVGFQWRQMLCESDEGTGLWLDVEFSVEHVKNELGFCEVITNSGGGDVQPGFVGSIGDALRGNTVFGDKAFCYGKIPTTCSLEKTAVGDVEVQLGYTFVHCDGCSVQSYFGVIIPTGNKPHGEFIFEPIVGNNHHWGFNLGGQSEFAIYTGEQRNVWLNAAFNGAYLLPNTQRRSFDLVDKQWSRYIWLYPNDQATALTDINPGINFFTQWLRVHPKFAYTTNIALLFESLCNGFEWEVGYNVYARQAEDVCLDCPWQVGPGIAGIDQFNADRLVTKSHATISLFEPENGTLGNDLTFVAIQPCDLNLASAAHPAMLTHTVYGALGYRWDSCNYPLLFGIGGSYEFSSNNVGLDRWLVWGKFGISL